MNATSTRSPLALSAALGLLGAAAAAQGPSNVDEVLGHVATRVEEYFARAQKVVFVEKTMIQYVRTDLTPQGFARVLEADLRVESDPADRDGSSEAKVVRELRKVNGHRPRPKDDQDCLDPNPISPEPLAFLLPAQRSKYAFTLAGRGKGKDKNTVMVDFRELGTGKPEVKERSDKAEGCFSIDLPGRGRGRVWLDASTYEVLRVDQRVGYVDFRVPDPRNRRLGLGDVGMLERLDTSIRYKPVVFSDPEESVLLPESIETLMIVRGMQSYRMRQVFSNYRRFVTGGRLVK
jgi:hypothetical protein